MDGQMSAAEELNGGSMKDVEASTDPLAIEEAERRHQAFAWAYLPHDEPNPTPEQIANLKAKGAAALKPYVEEHRDPWLFWGTHYLYGTSLDRMYGLASERETLCFSPMEEAKEANIVRRLRALDEAGLSFLTIVADTDERLAKARELMDVWQYIKQQFKFESCGRIVTVEMQEWTDIDTETQDKIGYFLTPSAPVAEDGQPPVCEPPVVKVVEAQWKDDDKDVGGERFTDLAHAKRLAVLSAGELRHADEMGEKWYTVGPMRWTLNFKHSAVPYVKRVSQAIFKQSESIKDDEERARYYRAALKLESRDGINACLDLAKSMPGIRSQVKDFDAHPLWLNTRGGTVNLENGEVWSYRPADLLTKVTNAGYRPQAPAPTWDRFLAQVVPDPAVRSFLQRSVGYALSDLMGEQCMWFLYGLGRNGKTTFINAIRRMMGDYAMTTRASTLMVKRHGDDRRNDVAVLKGARFVSATEAEDGQALAESLLKEITGQDPITARLLYAEFFTFEPTFKIWLAANHKPIIHGTDLAIWRRIHLVPFVETIPADQVDRELPEKLYAERDGILNWALAGWQAYREGGLRVPKLVEQATANYKAEMDPLADFLEEACIVEAGETCTAGDLYLTYQRWATDAGIRSPLSQRALATELQERGFEPCRTGHQRTRGWRGLRPTKA